jgi:MFS transporter, ACS family, hexuronate transporter
MISASDRQSSEDRPSEFQFSGNPIRGLRWWIAGVLFLGTFINFLDRLTISVLAPVITVQLGLTNLEFAGISSWFLLAYTMSQPMSGKLYDRIGNKRGFTISILIWASAAMAHAFVRSLAGLSFLRFCLGLGEAGNWPGAAKVIAEWFPPRERALGMGIFNSGTALASVAAPPLIVWLQLRFGWQATFLATGALGFAWLVIWRLVYESPERHPSIGADEFAMIQSGRQTPAQTKNVRWLPLFKYPQVWAIVLARFFGDPVWWLYITWLPLYLFKVRGFSLREIGLFAWVPYVAADAGSLIGGWLPGFAMSRGWDVNRARKAVLLASTALMAMGILTAFAATPAGALATIAIVLFGFQSWINNVQTMPSDFFPEHVVGAVAGLGGMGAGVGAILFTLATGFVTDHFHSYTPILVMAGLLPILGTVALFSLGGRIREIEYAY